MGPRPTYQRPAFFSRTVGGCGNCWLRKLTLTRPVLPTHAEDELREALAQSQGQLMDLQVRMGFLGSYTG